MKQMYKEISHTKLHKNEVNLNLCLLLYLYKSFEKYVIQLKSIYNKSIFKYVVEQFLYEVLKELLRFILIIFLCRMF